MSGRVRFSSWSMTSCGQFDVQYVQCIVWLMSTSIQWSVWCLLCPLIQFLISDVQCLSSAMSSGQSRVSSWSTSKQLITRQTLWAAALLWQWRWSGAARLPCHCWLLSTCSETALTSSRYDVIRRGALAVNHRTSCVEQSVAVASTIFRHFVFQKTLKRYCLRAFLEWFLVLFSHTLRSQFFFAILLRFNL